ncbi:sodium-and chloride-dependent transporter [Helicobacter didelphidarum]|uniref:Sodium-and chloride-dependent transporter n=1 Tax=Helicobacter didelphidarum TaxID=2040648 RepID=A0A3D8IP84_9HELI|nr:sodium-dependent transporter [Helicobacter didelphidarum]RDU66716.1 sodium-and chloride-dependent transporter [Helicobacter didelphidarum]
MTNFSKIGFIMATLGSSIGLGHIWRFPTMAGQNGGAAFILLFLIISVAIGVSMLIAEMLIGNRTRTNAQDAFYILDESKHKKWHLVGLTIIGGPLILTFYCIVLGWVVYYLAIMSLHLPDNMTDSKLLFAHLKQNFTAQIISFAVVIILTAYFVAKGVKNGIEKLNFVLMPLLFIIFIGLLIYAMTLEHFSDSFHFMFAPDFSKITAKTLIDSMGQVFFSLSLGIGIVVTYAAFTDEKQNLFNAALWVLIPGIIISIIAGLTIFTFVFEYGTKADVGEGEGLVFITLPVMFGKMGTLGSVICMFFMVGLAFAGISSTISLLEPSVKWLEDKTGKNRAFLSWVMSGIIFIVGSVLILSLDENHDELSFGGKSLFVWADWISANILMTLGGIITALFVGFAIKTKHLREWTKSYLSPLEFTFWLFAIRILAPLMVGAIFIYQIYTLIYPLKTETAQIEINTQKQESRQDYIVNFKLV